MPDRSPPADERVDGLLDGTGRRAHHDDHPLRIRRAVVVDEAVAPAGPGLQLVA